MRPESIVLSDMAEGAAPAEVIECTFRGNLNEFQVKLAGQTLQVQTRPKQRVAVGAKVAVALDPGANSIFERS